MTLFPAFSWRFLHKSFLLCILGVLLYLSSTSFLIRTSNTVILKDITKDKGKPENTSPTSTKSSIGLDPPKNLTKESHLILIWTSYFGNNGLTMLGDYNQNCLKGCLFITNRSLLTSASAVIFHSRSMGSTDFPISKPPGQVWVYLNRESPTNTHEDLTAYSYLFNWTMTYNSNSDVLHPYGRITPRSPNLLPTQVSQQFHKINNTILTKSKLAVWVSSHCETDSKREHLVAQLRHAGIEIDVFGTCGNKSCPRRDEQEDICFKKIESTYKFYLSFENSLCKDYITEKFFMPLNLTIVPVVFGTGNYSMLAPSHSYIDVRDFKGVGQLAGYLLYLNKHMDQYMKYFEWKQYYAAKESDGWCKLCQKLHDRKIGDVKIVTDLDRWYRYDIKNINGEEVIVSHCKKHSGNFSYSF